MIEADTKAGSMKNKRFLPTDKLPPGVWKKVVDTAVAGRTKLLAVTPSSIKTAMTHRLDWFARIKANHYSNTTPLGSWTLAEVKKITDFERTKCGIKLAERSALLHNCSTNCCQHCRGVVHGYFPVVSMRLMRASAICRGGVGSRGCAGRRGGATRRGRRSRSARAEDAAAERAVAERGDEAGLGHRVVGERAAARASGS